MRKNVLIVGASLYMRATLKDMLEEGGYYIIGQATSSKEALRMAFTYMPDYVMLTNTLPNAESIEVMYTYKREGLPSKVLMISSANEEAECIDNGLDTKDYLLKPFTSDQLLRKLSQA